MSLTEWDFKVAPYLRHIETHAAWLEIEAQKILNAATVIGEMPQWQTKAEDAIDRASKKLQEAQEILRGKRNSSTGSDQ